MPDPDLDPSLTSVITILTVGPGADSFVRMYYATTEQAERLVVLLGPPHESALIPPEAQALGDQIADMAVMEPR